MLNSKYIKTKRNQKLKTRFFKPFQVLHSVGNQAYKLELPKQRKIDNVFYVSLLEQDTKRKKWVDIKIAEPLKFKTSSNNEEYKVESICNSAIHAKELEAGQLSGLYYLVSRKNYPKDENTWEPTSIVQYLWKLVSIFYKNHSNKPTATSLPIDFAPQMVKHTTSLNVNSNWKPDSPISSLQKKVKH